MSDLSFSEVGEILRLIGSMNCRSLVLDYGDLRLQVHRGPRPPGPGRDTGAPASTAAPEHASAAGPDDPPAAAPEDITQPSQGETGASRTEPAATDRQVAVRAPMAGTFYGRPAPDQPPFAAPGDRVEAGQPVGLLEVMKLFTEMKAETAGIVARICAEDGELVEYEQPLVWIEPS